MTKTQQNYFYKTQTLKLNMKQNIQINSSLKY